MAQESHVAVLKQGTDTWNEWRKRRRGLRPQLQGVKDLQGLDLAGADLRNARLSYADLSGSNLSGANLTYAKLTATTLRDANLKGAILSEAKLNDADLTGADLTGADLRRARLVRTNLSRATLDRCRIYGISAWSLTLDGTLQSDLVITDDDEPVVTVDDMEVAQFVHLLLSNPRLRHVIQTVGEKAVLILGRFSPERKAVLDAVRGKLRKQGYVPIMFDFQRPDNRDFTETIVLLAGMSLFVIADLTEPRSIPLELQATVPQFMIPFVPVYQAGDQPFAMFGNLRLKYSWVLKPVEYADRQDLLGRLQADVIGPALEKHKEIVRLKAESVSEQ